MAASIHIHNFIVFLIFNVLLYHCQSFILFDARHTRSRTSIQMNTLADSRDPLLLRTARGEIVERTPVWMMRQAGRHMEVGFALLALQTDISHEYSFRRIETFARHIQLLENEVRLQKSQ